MDYQNLLIEQKERIRYIIINRESKLNALNAATINELSIALKDAFDDNATGGIIITGAGDKAFVAGADIAELKSLNSKSAKEMAAGCQKSVFDLIEHGPKPVIAAINGFALGGGLELAMACHIRIAAGSAKMGLPEVSLGLIPGYGGTQRLTQLAGKGKAMEMIITGEMITAAEALQYKVVNYVVEANKLLATAEDILGKILRRAPLAVSAAIKAVNAGLNPQENGYSIEISQFAGCFDTEDVKEGIAAFLEKRPPHFTGS